jgi:hypothetical protein
MLQPRAAQPMIAILKVGYSLLHHICAEGPDVVRSIYYE